MRQYGSKWEKRGDEMGGRDVEMLNVEGGRRDETMEC